MPQLRTASEEREASVPCYRDHDKTSDAKHHYFEEQFLAPELAAATDSDPPSGPAITARHLLWLLIPVHPLLLFAFSFLRSTSQAPSSSGGKPEFYLQLTLLRSFKVAMLP